MYTPLRRTMIEDQHILIEKIDDPCYSREYQRRFLPGPMVSTSDYLDNFYLDIYEAMYQEEPYCHPNPDIGRVVSLLGEFIREVGVYLNAQGPAPIITKAKVRLSSGAWSTRLWFGGDVRVRLGLLTGEDILVKLLGYQYVDSPQPQYALPQCPANQFSGEGHGVHGLYTEMQKILGYLHCHSCKYSDNPAKFCGRGMQMYTGSCTSKALPPWF